MVTLRHAFDANSMKGLVLKILRGNYPTIPSTYSNDLKELIADMLIKDPVKRPSMRKILEKEFLSRRISKLLTTTIAKNEFSSTFVTKHLTPHQSENNSEASQKKTEETKEGSETIDAESNSSVVISKQKIVINKEAGIKKRSKLAVASSGGHEEQTDFSEGVRKEVPQTNELVNQARSKYFPSSGSNQSQPPKIKLAEPVSRDQQSKQYHSAAAGGVTNSLSSGKDYNSYISINVNS